MPTTRFPERASGPAERLAGFMAHLRLNGINRYGRQLRIGSLLRHVVRCFENLSATGR